MKFHPILYQIHVGNVWKFHVLTSRTCRKFGFGPVHDDCNTYTCMHVTLSHTRTLSHTYTFPMHAYRSYLITHYESKTHTPAHVNRDSGSHTHRVTDTCTSQHERNSYCMTRLHINDGVSTCFVGLPTDLPASDYTPSLYI